MIDINKIIVSGNLVREPELKTVSTGSSVATFSIGVNSTWKSSSGEKKKNTNYFRILVWGAQAEACAKYLDKGRPVLIEGRLEVKSYKNKENEQKYLTQIIGEQVTFLPSAKLAQ